MSCPSISSYEGVALRFAQPEPQRLEGGNQIDFPVASADRVPIGQHDALVFAEQVSPPGVTVDQPGRGAESWARNKRLGAARACPQPATFVLIEVPWPGLSRGRPPADCAVQSPRPHYDRMT